MKIYTKTGDHGETSLFSGKRVSKSHELIELFGMLDELNTCVGFLYYEVSQNKDLEEDKKVLYRVQTSLFSIGSYFASEFSLKEQLKGLKAEIEELENKMDAYTLKLAPLKNFILPGGSKGACAAHQARVLSRNVERKAVSLKSKDEKLSQVLVYLNRISDFFFVFARHINFIEGVEEPVWKS